MNNMFQTQSLELKYHTKLLTKKDILESTRMSKTKYSLLSPIWRSQAKSLLNNQFCLVVINDPLARIQIKPVLTIKSELTFYAKPYNPLGLILQTRMFDNLFFWKTIQSMKKEREGKIMQVHKIEDKSVKYRWLNYFKM